MPESPTCEQVLQWVLATCLAVAEAPAPLMALRLLLASAQVASEAAGLELLAYELFERCFLLYEESVADQRHKVVALQGILGALHRWGQVQAVAGWLVGWGEVQHVGLPVQHGGGCPPVLSALSPLLKLKDMPPAMHLPAVLCVLLSSVQTSSLPAPSPTSITPSITHPPTQSPKPKPQSNPLPHPPAHRCYVFTPENRDALVGSATAYASKLLKRSDQCKAVCACTHLSWQPPRPDTSPKLANSQPPVRDVQKVLACLKRAIKIANAAKQQRLATALPADASHVALYVEVLNLYLQFFEESTDVVGASMVEQMVELIREEMGRSEAAVNDATRQFWEATVAHVKARGSAGGEAGLRFAALQL